MSTKLKLFFVGLLLTMAAMASACSYAGVAATDDETVVIAKNNSFLFGILNSVHVCKVSDSGLSNCSSGAAP